MIAADSQQPSIKQLLSVMNKLHASDIYLTAGMPPSYRIDGIVQTMSQPPLTALQCEQLSDSIMTDKQRDIFANEHEMNLALALDKTGRFRVNIFRQRGHVGMVIRKINLIIPTLDELGLPEIFRDIVMEPRGLVLMVGATGCGKSSSLAAMIDWRNSNQTGHIISIEDPIEFLHQHKKSVITQREIGTDTLEYQAALKNTLRQAPDVILIGEIRDRETMEHAIEFSETGHLCLATLHANNANQALERIINFFPEDLHPQVCLNLALNLKAVLSQRLVRSLDGKRLPAVEILINTPRISDLIAKWAISDIKEAMASGKNYGMQTFDQALLALWMDGLITENEALRHADSVNNLRLKIKMVNLQDSGDHAGDLEQMSGNIRSRDLDV
ncbi:MAG: PilT/PilU family type 4a pilus ATPase [Mariprofundus sp.]